MKAVGQEGYYVFGVAAVAFFLVAAARAFAFRQYRALLDPDGPMESGDGSISGAYSGRRLDLGLVPSVHANHEPAKVQISVLCAVPFRIEAHRRSLAVSLRRAVGILGDRKTGSEDLDRRFTFEFDDRLKTEETLGRIEARESLIALADLGADLVLLTGGRLTVEIPMPFIVPPGAGRVQRALASMSTFASVAESVVSGRRVETSWSTNAGAASSATGPDGGVPWPVARTSGATVGAPVFYGAFFVAMILGWFILGSFWSGRVPWQTRMATVSDRLPAVAFLAMTGGFLSGLIVPRRPFSWAVLISWPLALHAVLVGVVYVILQASGIPEVHEALGRELEAIPAGLKTAAIVAGVSLGSGLAGALLGGRLGTWGVPRGSLD